MKNVVRTMVPLLLVAIIAMPLAAADKERKKRKQRKKPDPAASVLKRLEKAELTEEQIAKIKALAVAAAEKTKPIFAKAPLTAEQKAAMKKAREQGKKGAEYDKAVGLSDEQRAAIPR